MQSMDIQTNVIPEKNITQPVADPIKLFFFANEEFFRFLVLSLSVCYI
jgi:hypothetical protein